MADIEKQVTYWRNGAAEDWEVAQELVRSGRVRHGLFFAHLALEKMLKAHICRRTGDVPPRMHNLVRLAQLLGMPMSEEQMGVLAEMNALSIEGRYPDAQTPPPERAEAEDYLVRAGEILRWLTRQLSSL